MKINENNTQLQMTAGIIKQFPKDPLPHIVLSGRSNVGKSSLINCLLNRKNLARVSSSPGKTITVNFYNIDKKLFFVDLPGYGFAKRAPEDKEKWSSLTNRYLTDEETRCKIKLVLQLVDMKVGITNDDAMMLDWLCQTKTPFIVVATKSDKLNKTDYKKAYDRINSELKSEFQINEPVVLPFSSLKRDGREKLWNYILEYSGV